MKPFAVIFFICYSINTPAQSNREILQKIKLYEEYLIKFSSKKNLPSLSFAILKDQKLVYSNAIGFADIEKQIPATDSTAYSIASLTKPIAASLILRLFEEGRLDIYKKMRDYWPGYDKYFSTLEEELPKKNPQFLAYISNYNFRKYPITIWNHLTHTSQGVPGSEFVYNGFLFGRLVSVVDHVVPQKFYGLMDSLVFRKLMFEHSFLQYDDISNSLRTHYIVARPYQKFGDRDSLVEAPFPDPKKLNAGAGLILSVKDLAKFDIAFDQDKIISAKTKALMFTPVKNNKGRNLQYGLGWFIAKYRKTRVVYHYGLQETYSSFWLKIPEKNITLILFSNSSGLTIDYGADLIKTRLSEVPYAARFLELFSGK